MSQFDSLRGNGLREVVERLVSDGDRDWHILGVEDNYVWRADRAAALRAKAKREGLAVEIRSHKPNVELRLL